MTREDLQREYDELTAQLRNVLRRMHDDGALGLDTSRDERVARELEHRRAEVSNRLSRAEAESAADHPSVRSGRVSIPMPGAIRRAFGHINRADRAASDFVRDKASAFDNHAHTPVVVIVALLIHLYDLANGFSRSGAHMTVMFTAHILFAFWMIFFYYRTMFTPESGRFLGISLLAFLVPRLLYFDFVENLPLVIVFIAFLPVWVHYILMHSGGAWRRLSEYVLIGLALMLTIMVLSRVTFPDLGSQVGTNLGDAFVRVGDQFSESWDRIVNVFTNTGATSIPALQERILNTFNPNAILYPGVEEETEEPQGVFITGLRSLYDETPVGTEPIIFGRIEARTFIDEPPVYIRPRCTLLRGSRDGYVGDPGVSEPFQVNQFLTRDVTCTFPADENMRRGTYRGILGAEFNFETWAYAFYTFVSTDTLLQYAREGKDIYSELAISPRTETIYTNGPVEIGMTALEQPVDIDPDATDGRFIKQRFGFTVNNKWSQGEVSDVTYVRVLVPEPFVLENCLPIQPVSEGSENEMHWYEFDKNDVDLHYLHDFRTVTCDLNLPSRGDARRVLDFGEKTPATFVVQARYRYVLEQDVPVRMVDI